MNNFEMSPAPLLKSYYGPDYDLEHEIKKSVKCHDCSCRLACLVAGFRCIDYAVREVQEWCKVGKIPFIIGERYKIPDNREGFRMKVSMHKYDYTICIVPPALHSLNGYMGAFLTNRDNGRGNDLPDGSYSFCTFLGIVFHILAVEAKYWNDGFK